MAFKIN